MKKGAFVLFLHCHIPFCRMAGRWPHGEEWLHQAASETYLPLLKALYSLKQEGYPFHLCLGMTPILIEQLSDPLILENLEDFLKLKISRAYADLKRNEVAYLARFYYQFYQDLLESFVEEFGRDIISAFKRLQDEGLIEIATSAATHAYLPLLSRDSSIYAQIKVGIESYKQRFGTSPSSFWLPECGYRPSFYSEAGYIKPGLEYFLEKEGIKVFFVETHTIEGGEPVGKAKGEVIGPYAIIPRRYLVPISGYIEPRRKTTYQPYWVGNSGVAVLGRNNRTSLQVWSADHGYPGDFRYREFHKKDSISGLQYWRVSDARKDLATKELYHPDWAQQAVLEHSHHFASLIEGLLSDYYQQSGNYGIVLSAYDAELFGHWWFEGIMWLKEVLKLLSRSKIVELTTPSKFIKEHPPDEALFLPESSWGQGGGHFTWDNIDTKWVWEIIHKAEREMEELVSQYPEAEDKEREILCQIGRELLLLQSSDWTFLITTGQAKDYAIMRVLRHWERFQNLAQLLKEGKVENALIESRLLYASDNPFPLLDYKYFANREGTII